MVYITRKERFSAAHKLSIPEWSDEKNLEVFGKCSNPNWHGHNYELWVTVKGEPDKQTGFVLDLRRLSEIINEKIVDKLDHKNINMDVDFMKGKMSSTEVLAIAIWDEIKLHIDKLNCKLHCVKLQETSKNSVEYFGE
ncbi:MAG: 6-carboxytetrahydropterin synthase [Bacteroidia bacterium]|nr:6-carboxytetrahydropterin synthase [Bacteroidia bacterium]NNC85243.1 6-carboxytetrahydropterin synthase [Bacteroidia bacterium]NNM16009.1 6-carboxytetrahydropterin synthase [Bacteroidia bacterium]